MAATKLHLVNPETGEARLAPEYQRFEDEIDGLQHTIRSLAATIANLKRELRPEEGHDLFPIALRLFEFWKERCRHPFHPQGKPKCAPCGRTKFSVERFKEVRPRLQEHDEEMCRRAIEGAAYDPYCQRRKNGTIRRHNDWNQVWNADRFEEFCSRAPYHLPDPKRVLTLANALAFLHPEWENARAVAEAQGRLR